MYGFSVAEIRADGMRFSSGVWSRAVARPRRSKPVQTSQKWSKETARVFELVLRNQAPSPWPSSSKYAEMPPQIDDVSPSLPLLESRALAESAKSKPRNAEDKQLSAKKIDNIQGTPNSEGLQTLAEFAFKLGIISELSAPFLSRWIRELVDAKNVFEASRIYKSARKSPPYIGVDLYLRANQPQKAMELARQIPLVPPVLRRRFIEACVSTSQPFLAQKWIDSWQDMQPADLRWLHHISNEHNISDWKLPDLPENVTVTGKHVWVGESSQHLVSRLNEISATSPDSSAQQEICSAWMSSIGSPSRQSLENSAVVVAKYTAKSQDSSANSDVGINWSPVLRLVNASTARQISRSWKAWSPPKAFATVLSRSKAEDSGKIVELMSPEIFYSPECLHAIARKDPALFAEMTVPQEMLETALLDHHLISLWRAENHELEWLFPLTSQFKSPRLSRAASRTLVKKNDKQRAEESLTDFVVTKRSKSDPKVLQIDKRSKLSRAQPSQHTEDEAREVVNQAISSLFKSN